MQYLYSVFSCLLLEAYLNAFHSVVSLCGTEKLFKNISESLAEECVPPSKVSYICEFVSSLNSPIVLYQGSLFVIQRVKFAIDQFREHLESLPNAIKSFAQKCAYKFCVRK